MAGGISELSCCLQAFDHLQSFVAECDRKMEQSKKRLKETQEELSEEASAKVCIYVHIVTFIIYLNIYCKHGMIALLSLSFHHLLFC